MGMQAWPQRLQLQMVTSSSSSLQPIQAALADAKTRDGAVRPWHSGCGFRHLLGSVLLFCSPVPVPGQSHICFAFSHTCDSAGEKNESGELRFQTKWSGELVVRRAAAATKFMFEMDLPLERMDAKTPEWAHDSSVLVEVQCCKLYSALGMKRSTH